MWYNRGIKNRRGNINMPYILIPVFVLISAFYFYPKDKWKPFYRISVALSVLGLGVSAVHFKIYDSMVMIHIPYVFSNFYIVINLQTLFMLMGVYAVLLVGMLVFKHKSFAQTHDFEKVIILWLHALFVIFAISAQNILQVLFAWAGVSLCIFAISAYKDEKDDTGLPVLYTFFSYICPLILLIVAFVSNALYTPFGAFAFVVSVCSILGIVPFNAWVERFFVQAKAYAVVMCMLKIVLAVKLIQVYMDYAPADFILLNSPILAFVGGVGMLIGAMIVYNQVLIFKRLAYMYGMFGGLGLILTGVFPLSYVMLFMLYNIWIYMGVAILLCIVHYVLSGEQDIRYMGGLSQYTPTLYILYFVIMMGIGYVPIHIVSLMLGKALTTVNMSYSPYENMVLGAMFIVGQFMLCYGFGRMGALIFTQEGNRNDMVTAYIRPPSKTLFTALLCVLVCMAIFGFISYKIIVPNTVTPWQYTRILYTGVVGISIMAFVMGLGQKNSQIKTSEIYMNNVYINVAYKKLLDMLLVILHHSSQREQTEQTEYLKFVSIDNTAWIQKFTSGFRHITKSYYGMGYHLMSISTLALVILLLGHIYD